MFEFQLIYIEFLLILKNLLGKTTEFKTFLVIHDTSNWPYQHRFEDQFFKKKLLYLYLFSIGPSLVTTLGTTYSELTKFKTISELTEFTYWKAVGKTAALSYVIPTGFFSYFEKSFYHFRPERFLESSVGHYLHTFDLEIEIDFNLGERYCERYYNTGTLYRV